MPSFLQMVLMDSSPRNPEITILIFSSELNLRLVRRRISLITASAFFGSFSLIVSNLWFLSITLFSHTYVHFMLTIYTMDPKAMEWQAKAVQNGQFLYCPNGSHLSMWDDQAVFMGGIIKFIRGTAGFSR